MRSKQLRDITTRPAYLLIAAIVAFLVLTFAVWLPNIRLIGVVLLSGSTSIVEKLNFLLSLYGSIQTNFTVVSASYTIAIAILFGVTVALLVYYIRAVRGGLKGIRATGVAGIGGLVSGIFGIGCAACGTFILSTALALFGASGILAFLPFAGGEFGFLGVGLLMYSIYALAKKIEKPPVCEIT